jgi:aspartyl-tRNA(Asn)/glutamyl-tRNA(Gln) amidotransferase subunit C
MNAPKFEVQYVAELARIKLTPEEIQMFQSQLVHVLEHVARLDQIDLTGVEPTAHSFPIYNVFRPDETRPSFRPEVALANAPRQGQGLFLLPKVVE